jgi:uncharacterized membrane protein YbhN (UPF0104 family)
MSTVPAVIGVGGAVELVVTDPIAKRKQARFGEISSAVSVIEGVAVAVLGLTATIFGADSIVGRLWVEIDIITQVLFQNTTLGCVKVTCS